MWSARQDLKGQKGLSVDPRDRRVVQQRCNHLYKYPQNPCVKALTPSHLSGGVRTMHPRLASAAQPMRSRVSANRIEQSIHWRQLMQIAVDAAQGRIFDSLGPRLRRTARAAAAGVAPACSCPGTPAPRAPQAAAAPPPAPPLPAPSTASARGPRPDCTTCHAAGLQGLML